MEFTFDNGIKAELFKVSPTMWGESERIVQGLKRPTPPVQMTELGEEQNFANPDFLAATDEYNKKIDQARMNAFLLLGVEVEVDTAAVARLRKRVERMNSFLRSSLDTHTEGDSIALAVIGNGTQPKAQIIELDQEDHLVYLKHFCITTNADMLNLMNAIVGVSIPTEDKISERAESFKSPVEAQ